MPRTFVNINIGSKFYKAFSLEVRVDFLPCYTDGSILISDIEFNHWTFKMPNIKIQSSDGEVFHVDVEIAKQSVTIRTMLEDLGMDEGDEEVNTLINNNTERPT